MTLIDTIGNMPSLYRRQKQVNKLAEIRISGDSGSEILNFTQHDVLTLDDYGPLLVVNSSEIGDNDIEITITYNAALTVDYIISKNTDMKISDVIQDGTTTVNPYQITDIIYKVATPDKGTSGDIVTFYNITGNHGKTLSLHNFEDSELLQVYYEFLRNQVLTQSSGDWIDQIGESWGLLRLPGETDADYIIRIVARSTPTDGTVASVIDRVRSYLGLSESDDISILESYDQEGWIMDQSQFLAFGQSQLVLTGDYVIEPMQFQMNISGYTGSLTEADIENYLRTVINVGASPIVRLV